MTIKDELRAQANQHPLDADLEMFNVAASRISELENALRYAIDVGCGWYDDLRGRDLIDDDEVMAKAKKTLGA